MVGKGGRVRVMEAVKEIGGVGAEGVGREVESGVCIGSEFE